jgi:hypothetical protein
MEKSGMVSCPVMLLSLILDIVQVEVTSLSDAPSDNPRSRSSTSSTKDEC